MRAQGMNNRRNLTLNLLVGVSNLVQPAKITVTSFDFGRTRLIGPKFSMEPKLHTHTGLELYD